MIIVIVTEREEKREEQREEKRDVNEGRERRREKEERTRGEIEWSVVIRWSSCECDIGGVFDMHGMCNMCGKCVVCDSVVCLLWVCVCVRV